MGTVSKSLLRKQAQIIVRKMFKNLQSNEQVKDMKNIEKSEKTYD